MTKRTVFSVDARNHGDSPHTKLMSYATMAKDIEQFVKQIEAPKISFLGMVAFLLYSSLSVNFIGLNIFSERLLDWRG